MSDSFTFKNFSLSSDYKTVSLNYELEHEGVHQLTETFVFESPLTTGYETNQLLRALHLACGISYYKSFLPPVFSQPYKMDDTESAFWNSVYRGGLGEFLYVNKLDPTRLISFEPQEGLSNDKSIPMEFVQTAVLGIGGGKDSIVAGEALKRLSVPLEGFVMATGDALGQVASVAKTMDVPLNVVSRSLDKKLLELQELPGAYKGHIPISLIFALVGSLIAVSKKAQFVVVANEDSASTPHTEWAGKAVNHQWSKSFWFEGELQKYLHAHVSPELFYFSAIRPVGSVGIARAFAKLSQYYEVFTSDNFAFRIDPAKRPNSRWSLESPKSLSSFILLSPWIDEIDMLRIFGINFLDKIELKGLFLSLIGKEGEPPLDCVGTPEELSASLYELVQQGKWQGSSLLLIPELEDVPSRPLQDFIGLSENQHFPAAIRTQLTDVLKEFTS